MENEKEIVENFKAIIKRIYEIATKNDNYQYGSMLLYEPKIDFLIFKSFKFRDQHKLPAYFLHGIATTHPFIDGNKRTALLLGILLMKDQLELEGASRENVFERILKLLADYVKQADDKVVKFMIETADEKHSVEDVDRFLREILD